MKATKIHAHRCPGCKETYGCDCSMPEEESVFCKPCWDIAESEKRRSEIDKSIRFDEIVLASKHYFEAFSAEHRMALKKSQQPGIHRDDLRRHVNDAQRFAALSHEHYQVLKIAGVDVVCDCAYCQFSAELIAESPERMVREIKERIQENLNEVEP